LEDSSETRHEFYEGELFPIEATTANHNRIKRNIARLWEKYFDQNGCETFDDGVKVELIANKYFVYPDVFVSCDEADLAASLVMRSPVLIAEVLSKGTANYDRTTKRDHYLKLPSLQYYLLVDSLSHHAELYSRLPEGWHYQTFDDLSQTIHFPLFNISVSLELLYEKARISILKPIIFNKKRPTKNKI
jgi:Uma2 family endonuclease